MFYNSKLLIIGGRGSDVNKPLPTSVYDTESCDWKNLASINRFRHYCWTVDNNLYSYGGFDHRQPSAPTNDLQVLDLDRALEELGVNSQGVAGTVQPTHLDGAGREVGGGLGSAAGAGEPRSEAAVGVEGGYMATGFNAGDDIKISSQVGSGGFGGYVGDDLLVWRENLGYVVLSFCLADCLYSSTFKYGFYPLVNIRGNRPRPISSMNKISTRIFSCSLRSTGRSRICS